MKRKPLLFSFPLKTLTTFKAKNAEYTQNTRRIHAEYTENALKEMKVKKNNETPFPLKTHNHPLRRKTQNTRRIHAEYTTQGMP